MRSGSEPIGSPWGGLVALAGTPAPPGPSLSLGARVPVSPHPSGPPMVEVGASRLCSPQGFVLGSRITDLSRGGCRDGRKALSSRYSETA